MRRKYVLWTLGNLFPMHLHVWSFGHLSFSTDILCATGKVWKLFSFIVKQYPVTSDTLPMKNWEPHGCWDDRGGVREVLLVQLDSVAFLAITSTRTMAFSGIMSQECAAKWLLSVLVRLGIFISYSCPFFKMAFMKIFTEWIAQVPSLQWWLQGSQDLRGWFQIAYISSVEIVWQLYETQQASS